MIKQYRLLALIVIPAIILSGVAVWSGAQHADAQAPNLLINGSLERPYYGQGAATRTVPNGWTLWLGAGAPDAFPHQDNTQVRDGEVSWNLKQGFTVFTAAGYQRVSVTPGDVLEFSAYGWVYTCNDTTTSCVIEEAPYRRSDTAAGASLKVGIDPNGGTDPNAGSIVWSGTAAPYDQWAQMTVSATAAGDAVTVFMHMTQTLPVAINNVYWDQASLVRTGEGEAPAEQAPPTQAFAPFVTAQSVRPDGSVVHVVQAGDTLSGIAFAYQELGVTVESIAELNAGIRTNTRFLQLGQEILILPPGSVDPVTGTLVTNPPAQQPPAEDQPPADAQPPADDQPPADQPPADEDTPPAQDDADAAPVDTEPLPGADDADQPADTADSDAEGGADYMVMRTAFFPFERGYMFWLEDTNLIYVLAGGEGADAARTVSTYQDTWMEGMPETDPDILPPVGFTQPDRRFGQTWRNIPAVREALGWGIGSTVEYTALVVRDGETLVISAPDNRVYEIDGDTWTVTDFYAADPVTDADLDSE